MVTRGWRKTESHLRTEIQIARKIKRQKDISDLSEVGTCIEIVLAETVHRSVGGDVGRKDDVLDDAGLRGRLQASVLRAHLHLHYIILKVYCCSI